MAEDSSRILRRAKFVALIIAVLLGLGRRPHGP